MRAAVYERTGPAGDVLTIQELPAPTPGPNEVRVKVAWSGINPSDVKTRAGFRTRTLAFPRIVPHSDGAGVIDQVGDGVDRARIGERVWLGMPPGLAHLVRRQSTSRFRRRRRCRFHAGSTWQSAPAWASPH